MEVLSTLGENIFSFNDFYGLTIQTNGNVILSKITTQLNGLYGATVNNSGGAGKTVSVNTMITKMNGGFGLFITTTGKATLTGVTSLYNGVGTDHGRIVCQFDQRVGIEHLEFVLPRQRGERDRGRPGLSGAVHPDKYSLLGQ